MKDKVSSEGFIKAFGNGVKDNREITQISDEVSSETDILIRLSEVENDIKMREAYEAGYEKAKTELSTRPQGKWGKWVITEIQCPNCLEYFQADCYSMEELQKCPNCEADMRGEKK